MANIWQKYGKNMANIWQICGKNMANIWQIYDKYMANILNPPQPLITLSQIVRFYKVSWYLIIPKPPLQSTIVIFLKKSRFVRVN